jgi:hypothetical protein
MCTHTHTHTHIHAHALSFFPQVAAILLSNNYVYVSENNGRVISIIASDCRLTMSTLYDLPSQFRKGIAVTPFGFGKKYMEVGVIISFDKSNFKLNVNCFCPTISIHSSSSHTLQHCIRIMNCCMMSTWKHYPCLNRVPQMRTITKLVLTFIYFYYFIYILGSGFRPLKINEIIGVVMLCTIMFLGGVMVFVYEKFWRQIVI